MSSSFSRRDFITTALGTTLSIRLNAKQIDKNLTIYHPNSNVYKKLNVSYNSDLSFTLNSIATFTDESSVISAVSYAKENKLKVTNKSDGHSFTEASLNNGSLIIDVSGMKQKSYRPKDKNFTASRRLLLSPQAKQISPYWFMWNRRS